MRIKDAQTFTAALRQNSCKYTTFFIWKIFARRIYNSANFHRGISISEISGSVFAIFFAKIKCVFPGFVRQMLERVSSWRHRWQSAHSLRQDGVKCCFREILFSYKTVRNSGNLLLRAHQKALCLYCIRNKPVVLPLGQHQDFCHKIQTTWTAKIKLPCNKINFRVHGN